MAPNATAATPVDTPVMPAPATISELEVLRATYDRSELNISKDVAGNVALDFDIPKLNEGQNCWMSFELSQHYPQNPAKFEVVAPFLSQDETSELEVILGEISFRLTGSPMVNALVTGLQGYLAHRSPRYGLKKAKKANKKAEAKGPAGACPEIVTADPIEDRASIFQGHMAQVNSLHEVDMVMEAIRSTKKIHRAKHNCYAYR